MRKFIEIFIFSLLIVVFIQLSIKMLCYIRYNNKIDLSVPDDVKTIVIGNSMGAYAFNDTILHWKNFCSKGEMYIESEYLLEEILKKNKNIDTIIVVAGIPSFQVFNDEFFYTEGNYYLQNKFGRLPYLSSSILEYVPNIEFIKFCLIGYPSLFSKEIEHSGYINETYNNLLEGVWGTDGYDKRLKLKGNKNYTKEDIIDGSHIQDKYLRRVINLCSKNNKCCVLVNTPIYHIDRWFDRLGYKDYLSTFGDFVLISDYSNFEIPSDTCYWDVHHLNYYGASYFSEYIHKNGLKIEYMRDYVSNKN